MVMKKIIILLTGACLISFAAEAQDIHFTQFNYSPLGLNPANAGAEHQVRANINYRNQWKTISSPFKTSEVSFDARMAKAGDGFFAGGINFYSDKAGDSKMGVAQGNISLAYHLKMAQTQLLGIGVMAGYAQRSMTASALQWGNQYDGQNYNAALTSGEPAGSDFTKSYLDLGAGIVWSYRKDEKYMTGNDHAGVNVGFSVMHVHQPDYSFYGGLVEPLHRKYVMHSNAIIGIGNSRISMAPGFMYAMQGGATEFLIGTNIRYRIQEDSHFTGFVSGASFSAGVWYRNMDAVSVTTMLQFSGYCIGFAYDFNISDLSVASDGKGGFELALRFVYPNSSKSSSTRFL
jgi:type IX secretion system PorP/SprF family membrane protein